MSRVTARALAVLLAAAAVWQPAVAMAEEYPEIPEPMVFDMIRAMGARRGELEANVLATSPLSGQHRTLEWAPEVEYALTNNFAAELELPFEGARLVELKMGLQATFGTLDGGRIVHGAQYLGIYDRESRNSSHALLYMVGRRHDARWSTMTMVGVGDVRIGQPEKVAGLLLNHSTFYDMGRERVAGLELNYKSGSDGGVTMMPQMHVPLVGRANMQVGAGLDKQRGARARPTAGVRLIREF